MSKVGWSSYNPHYSSLLLYQDKYGTTDRPLGTQQSPYQASSGEKTYGVKDPEYWRRYRERRSLGFPESAITTPYYVGKYAKPGFRYYNHMDYYYPSYGRSLIPRSHYYPSYYPYVDDYDYHSSLRPYSRYGYYSNWRYYDDSLASPSYSQSGGRWNMDFPGYTQRVGAAEIVKNVPQGFRLPVDFNARSSSLPPNNQLQAMGPSVPVSQIHTLDLEVLPANIDANLVKPKRLLESLNIGADDLNWVPSSTKTVKTTKRQLAITSSGGGSREWVRRRWSGYHDWMRRAYLDDVSLPYYYHHRYNYHHPTSHSSLLPRALPPSVTPSTSTAASTTTTDRRSANIARVVAAAAATTDFVTPLPPPYVLQKELLPRDPEREKIIKTSKRLYFDIMGGNEFVGVGGHHPPAVRLSDYPAVNTRDKSGIDRDGLLDLIKTKGVRIDSGQILDFLRYPQADGNPETTD